MRSKIAVWLDKKNLTTGLILMTLTILIALPTSWATAAAREAVAQARMQDQADRHTEQLQEIVESLKPIKERLAALPANDQLVVKDQIIALERFFTTQYSQMDERQRREHADVMQMLQFIADRRK